MIAGAQTQMVWWVGKQGIAAIDATPGKAIQ